jgi:tripeptide aminopeptidase
MPRANMSRSKLALARAVMVSAMLSPALAQAQTETGASPLAPRLEAAYAAVLANAAVTKALEQIKADDARTLEEQKRITEIPAPPFKERVRAQYYLKRMQDAGLSDASIDAEGNVVGLRKGAGGKPKLVVSPISTRCFRKAPT